MLEYLKKKKRKKEANVNEFRSKFKNKTVTLLFFTAILEVRLVKKVNNTQLPILLSKEEGSCLS